MGTEINRALAKVVRIEEIKPIPDADRICAYRVLGWWVVDQDGKYQVGDLVCYCEIDSFLPTDVAPFLTKPVQEPKEFNGVRGEKLRTVRLKGQISQGLLIPLTISALALENDLQEGADLTAILGIQKWEAPVPAQLAGLIRCSFPSVVPKTDQQRIQNCWQEIVAQHSEEVFEISQKLDGSSMTVISWPDDFHVCSRNLSLKEDPNNSFWKMALKYDIQKKLSDLGRNLAVQGEVIGEGIQGNPEKIKGQDFYVFDVYDINKGEYLCSEHRLDLCSDLGLKHVPVIGYKCVRNDRMDNLLDMADGVSLLNSGANKVREGLVFKSTSSQFSFKCISNRYLAKAKD